MSEDLSPFLIIGAIVVLVVVLGGLYTTKVTDMILGLKRILPCSVCGKEWMHKELEWCMYCQKQFGKCCAAKGNRACTVCAPGNTK